MKYNFKRALGLSVLLYLSTFVVGVAVGYLSGQDMSSMDNLPDSMWYVGMVAAVILSALFTIWYFRNITILPSAKSGFLFGLTAIVLGSILDLALFSAGNAGGANMDLGLYYGDYRFWVILVLVVATAKYVGWYKGRKNVVA